MAKKLLVLWNDAKRKEAADLCLKAEKETRVSFMDPKRTLDQNARFHAMCGDVADQIGWTDVFGRPIRMTPENWKRFFLAAWRRETLVVPNEDGTGFYDLGVRSSEMSVAEMGEIMEFISAFGAQRGVKFRDPAGREEQAA
jgi:hypothetical protein